MTETRPLSTDFGDNLLKILDQIPALQDEDARTMLLRGLPVAEWGEEKSSVIYWAIGNHLGRPGAQNELGELLGHIRDTGEAARDPNVRLYKTAADIAYHCDLADVVCLLCLQTSASGGASPTSPPGSTSSSSTASRPILSSLSIATQSAGKASGRSRSAPARSVSSSR